MAKSKSKPKETVLLIRIPDAEARRGEASLTIQRGDLGHLIQFNYTGLTLRGNIAEAVQTALIALAKLEAAPPPKFSTTPAPAQVETDAPPDPSTDENDSEGDDETDTSTIEETEESDSPSKMDDDADAAPAVANFSDDPETSAAEPSEHTTSATLLIPTAGDVIPANTAQMSLF